MENLVIMKNQQAVTTSLQVAEGFGKRHTHVIEAIEKKIDSAENSAQYKNMFAEGIYQDKSGKSNKMYYMNRDGFSFIAFGFTGRKADEFKLKYIDAFNKMENHIKEQQQAQLPDSYPAALRLLADKVEENEQLKAQLLAVEMPRAVVEQVELLPDVKLYTTREIAENLGFGGNNGAYRLCQILHNKKIIYPTKAGKRGYYWHLYAKYRDKGYKDMTSLKISQKWTLKGKEFIEEVLSDD